MLIFHGASTYHSGISQCHLKHNEKQRCSKTNSSMMLIIMIITCNSCKHEQTNETCTKAQLCDPAAAILQHTQPHWRFLDATCRRLKAAQHSRKTNGTTREQKKSRSVRFRRETCSTEWWGNVTDRHNHRVFLPVIVAESNIRRSWAMSSDYFHRSQTAHCELELSWAQANFFKS